MDWFVEKGEVENDINLFESAPKEESSLNATEFHSFAISDMAQSDGGNPGVENIKVNDCQVPGMAGKGETGKVEKAGSDGTVIEELAYFVQNTHSEGIEEIKGDEAACRASREGRSSSEDGETHQAQVESQHEAQIARLQLQLKEAEVNIATFCLSSAPSPIMYAANTPIPPSALVIEDEGEEEKEGVAVKRGRPDEDEGKEEKEVFTNQKEEEVVRPYSWFRKRL